MSSSVANGGQSGLRPGGCRRQPVRSSFLATRWSMASRPLRHPDIEDVTVADILHALADPVRLAIISELRDAASEMNCVETMTRGRLVLAKSTCSQHFQILREAGLIYCERKGVELSSRLRLRELEDRFPGVLSSILKAYKRDRHVALRSRDE